MKKLLFILPVIIFSALAFFSPQKALAAYDPGNLISDFEFRASSSMSEQQIRDFLNTKGGYISTYKVPAPFTDSYGFYNGTMIGPFDKEIDSTGWDVAKVIYMTANWYGISPKVILTTLEKEQSLVTATATDFSTLELARRIRWATGFAVTDSGVIPACSTVTINHPVVSNDNPTGSCAGIAMQIDWAAGVFAYRYNTPNSNFPVSQTVKIGNTSPTTIWESVYISNRATSSLYSYTPYTHGNWLFYYYYSSWFNPIPTIKETLLLENFHINNTKTFMGEKIYGRFSLTNTSSVDLHLDTVGLVGRPGKIDSSINRDFGWDANVNFLPNEKKDFYFETIIKDSGVIYVWPSFSLGGYYGGYFVGWTEITGRTPNVIVKQQLYTEPTGFISGQKAGISMIVVNQENKDFYYNSIGIPVRFYDKWNYDAVWETKGYIPLNSEKLVKGTVNFDKAGNYTAWGSIDMYGTYISLKNPKGTIYNLYAVKKAMANFGVSEFWLSNNQPIVGETIRGSFKLTNYLPATYALEAVGLVGRPTTIDSKINRDPGWYLDQTFAPWQTKTYNFQYTIKDEGVTYIWPSIKTPNSYYHFFPGWTEIRTNNKVL